MIEFSVHWGALLFLLCSTHMFAYFWGLVSDVPVEEDAPYQGEHIPEDFK